MNAASGHEAGHALAGRDADTFPRLLLMHAAKRGDRPAIREKDLGIWQTFTWSQVRDNVFAIAGGLAALGFKRGDSLAIIGENRPSLYWAMTAVQSLGGVPVPFYQDAVAQEMVFAFQNADIGFAIGPSQVDPRSGEILDADIGIGEVCARGTRTDARPDDHRNRSSGGAPCSKPWKPSTSWAFAISSLPSTSTPLTRTPSSRTSPPAPGTKVGLSISTSTKVGANSILPVAAPAWGSASRASTSGASHPGSTKASGLINAT